MKVLLALPFVLVCASCVYPEPYPEPRSPYYRPDGSRYAPYDRAPGPGPGPDSDYGAESGRYQPLDEQGTGPRQPDTRPAPAPRIEDDFDPQPAAPQSQPKPKPEYPVAEATETAGRVLSPYPPYNVIDVEGFKSGALAKDPSNGKIFRVP